MSTYGHIVDLLFIITRFDYMILKHTSLASAHSVAPAGVGEEVYRRTKIREHICV